MLTKILERGRLMSYLEQSTRYIGYDNRLPSGHYRYYRPPEILDSPLGARYVGDMDRMFDTYAELLPRDAAVARRPATPASPGTRTSSTARPSRPRPSTPCGASCRRPRSPTSASTAPASPTSCCSCACAAHPLPEARQYAEMMLTELRKVIPSFLQRVDLPERGGSGRPTWPRTRDDTARGGRAALARRPVAGRHPDRCRPEVTPGRLRPRGRGQGAGRRLLRPPGRSEARGRCAGSGPSAPTDRGPCWPPTWGTAPTAATVRAGPSSGPTTASSW